MEEEKIELELAEEKRKYREELLIRRQKDDRFFENGFFKGSTYKRGYMEEIRKIYKLHGERTMLEQVSERFFFLWGKNKSFVEEFLKG